MADKICPDCKGKKGKWRHTHSTLNPAYYPHIFIDCETCHGKGTVPEDIIRAAFENDYDIPVCLSFDGKYYHIEDHKKRVDRDLPTTWNRVLHGYRKGYKSRGPELEKWRIRNNKQEAKIIDQEEEIKKLKNQLSQLESHMGLPDLKGGK